MNHTKNLTIKNALNAALDLDGYIDISTLNMVNNNGFQQDGIAVDVNMPG